MSLRGALIGGVLAACAAAPPFASLAFAQVPPPPADAIDALLRQKTVDPEEPDTAATGSTAVEPDPIAPPQAYIPPPPLLKAPVFLYETGKAPDGPPTPADEAYDERLRASAAAVRGFQGPLEGGWRLSAGGRDVYDLQLIDRGGWVDGAWRDLRRPGALEGSGFIEGVRPTGGAFTVRFAADIVAVLRPLGGRWTGELNEGGRTEAVSLVRREP